jgi:hypothetical protein
MLLKSKKARKKEKKCSSCILELNPLGKLEVGTQFALTFW